MFQGSRKVKFKKKNKRGDPRPEARSTDIFSVAGGGKSAPRPKKKKKKRISCGWEEKEDSKKA